MGQIMFGNEFFDQWLNQKSLDILAKVEKEKISNEDMLILSLKAQVNHFHHMDIEFREEFRKIDRAFENVDKKFDQVNQRFEHMDQRIDQIDQRIDQMDKRFDQMDKKLDRFENKFNHVDNNFISIDKRFEQVDKRFEQVDKRFDHLTSVMSWGFGLFITSQMAIILKLFLG